MVDDLVTGEPEESEELLKERYTEIFEAELNNWYRDEKLWPKNREFDQVV